jgi:hypothetical protein
MDKVCCQVSRQLELIDQYLRLYFVDNLWKIKLLALDFICLDLGIIDVTFSYILDFMEEFIMDVFWCVCNDIILIYFGECNEIMIK